MNVDVETSTIIDKPRGKVAKFAANPANAPLGKQIEYTYEIVEYEPLELLVMRTHEGPFPMETTYTWEAVSPKSTRMTLRNRGSPGGFAKFAGPMVKRAIRKTTQNDLEALKELLESSK